MCDIMGWVVVGEGEYCFVMIIESWPGMLLRCCCLLKQLEE